MTSAAALALRFFARWPIDSGDDSFFCRNSFGKEAKGGRKHKIVVSCRCYQVSRIIGLPSVGCGCQIRQGRDSDFSQKSFMPGEGALPACMLKFLYSDRFNADETEMILHVCSCAYTPQLMIERKNARKASSSHSCNINMNDTLGRGEASRARLYFDAIDRAHELLENHKDLAKAIPSCVVVGMQSVGKSAVLSRVSGIPFPQDSEVCTRVAMELRLRRDALDNSMKITAGSTPVPVDATSNKSIEGALSQAQVDVLNGSKFEDKISVKIDKHGPDLPEVTLVDLPGAFFAKTDRPDDLALEKKVTEMIEERVRNNMALICHVVPLNQDTDTINTWRIVNSADADQSRTISILTKADLALKSGKESMKNRLKNIVKNSESSECFIVHGAAKDCADEEDQLATVRDYVEELRMENRILIGIDSLNAHIEERMLHHIKERIPEMKLLLEVELRSCKDELAKIGRDAVSPLAIAMRDVDAIMEAFDAAHIQQLPKLRKMTEAMSNDVFNINMELLGLVDFHKSKQILINHNARGSAFTDDMYRQHALAMEVKELEEASRKHINVPFVGKEEMLKRWIVQFSKPCNSIIKKYLDDSFEEFRHHIIVPSLEKGCSGPTKQVGRKVEAILLKIVADRCDEAHNRATETYEGIANNMFTTNEHYLTETADATKKIYEANFFPNLESSYAADMKPYFGTVYDIQGFLKTRKKFVPEAIQLITMRIFDALVNDTKAAIKATMVEESSQELIKEPASLVRRRKSNLEREKQIEKVFNEIRTL